MKFVVVINEKYKDFPLFEAETLQECKDFIWSAEKGYYTILYPDRKYMSFMDNITNEI